MYVLSRLWTEAEEKKIGETFVNFDASAAGLTSSFVRSRSGWRKKVFFTPAASSSYFSECSSSWAFSMRPKCPYTCTHACEGCPSYLFCGCPIVGRWSIARGPRRITHELTYLACPFLYFSSLFIRDCYSEEEGHLYSGSEKPQWWTDWAKKEKGWRRSVLMPTLVGQSVTWPDCNTALRKKD